MAQHDYNIANQSGADFRADLNNALLAIATVNSGATEPTTTFAHQLWVDTSSSVLKIRNAADNAWITTGVSITASNTFTGDLTGNVVGNVTGNLVGNVTGDLTGNADSADILSTARTISLSGDVVGSVSFDGSANVDIDTVVQINSITLGTDTTGDYVESLSGGTGVTVAGGTGEGSTPSIAIGQDVATTDDVTFNIITATEEFIGDLEGGIRFNAKADGALSKGDVVYISGVSGDVPTVAQAKADDTSKMPAFGLALSDANDNAELQVVTFGTIEELDTSGVSEGQILYVSTTAGAYTTTAPTGESSQIQNIGKVIRSHASAGSIKVGGAGRSNATPNLNDGKIFIGNASNQSSTATLDTSIVVENTNLYYTTARANTDFDTRLATKDTGDLTEGSNLYYTTARVNSDFDTRLATKSTTDLAEGTNLYYTTARFDSAFTSKDTDDLSEGATNLYYTTARFDSAFGNKTTSDLTEGTNLYYTDTRANSAIDTRVTKAFVDALGIQASSVDANSVTLGTDTVGNYVATVTGTANKITVTGSGSESANITLSLPDDVQIADSLTVAGNLTVNGTLTSLDTTNLDIEDNLFQLNAGLTGSPVNDSGMLINRGTADNSIFMWDESVDKFTLGLTTADGSATGNITLNSLGTLVANLEGNVTGAVTGTVSSLSNHNTDDLAEGSNLYYTQARFDSAFTAKSTSDLSEGTNLYYTDARFDTRLATKDTDDVSEGTTNLYYTTARFDSAFSGKSTSDLSEGTNLYYTSARANSDFDTRLATKDTGDLAEGSNLYYTDARADARVNLQTGANLDLSSKSTSDLSEGSNLYYTDARVQAVSINNVVEDTTPQLGGNLDLNSSDITGTGDINITGTIQSSGNITGTLATAAQPNITSVGTLTGFTSTGIDDNATSTAITIDSSERVLIGKNSSTDSAALEIDANNVGSLTYSARIENSNTATNIFNVLRFAQGEAGTATGIIGTGGSLAGNTAFRNTFAMITQNATGLVLGTNDTERLRIDGATGNVGIGTSSPNFKLHLKDGTSTPVYQQFSNDTTGNTSSDGTVLGIDADGDFLINNTESKTIKLFTADTERMRITSDGSVGIGSNNPAAKLEIQETDLADIRLESTTGTNRNLKISASSSAGGVIGMISNHRLEFHTNDTERMRITNDGNLLVGTTSTYGIFTSARVTLGDGDTGDGFCVGGLNQNKSAYTVQANNNTGTRYFAFITNSSGSQVGSISFTSSATAYNTSSDYRLKENVDYDFNALDRVAQLKPARFNFIADADTTVDGFLAHEVQDIVPEAITGTKDAVDDEGNPEYQGIDQSKLVPLLTKAIQEQQELINNLTARIEQLEN